MEYIFNSHNTLEIHNKLLTDKLISAVYFVILQKGKEQM